MFFESEKGKYFQGFLWIAGDSATYVTESLPFGTDQLETQLVMPSEEFINTHEMKSMLAREDLAEVPQQEALSVETSGEMVEAGHCKEVGWSNIIFPCAEFLVKLFNTGAKNNNYIFIRYKQDASRVIHDDVSSIVIGPLQVAPEENGQHPDVPSHPTVTRRAQFTVKQKIKEERAAAKGKGRGKGKGTGKGKGQGKNGKKSNESKGGKKTSGVKKNHAKNKRYQTLKKMNSRSKITEPKEPEEHDSTAVESNKRSKTATVAKSKKATPAKSESNRKTQDKTSKRQAAAQQPMPEKKSKHPKLAPATPAPIDADLKNNLVGVLQQCGGHANCTYECHEFTMPAIEAVSWSVYWKTNGVGVLLNPEYIEGYERAAGQTKPVKKKDWKHTTHFGAGYCTQCNLILANKWVSWLLTSACEYMYEYTIQKGSCDI